MASSYPNAVIIDNPTTTYNCHAYAWHMSEGGTPPVWMGLTINPTPIYWNDGSYFETTERGNGLKVSYDNPPYNGSGLDNHSAITTSEEGVFISKWGAYPLVKHAKDYTPYTYSSLHYFKKNTATISGPSLICDQGTYIINNLPSGATVNWVTNRNFNIVSGQGTSAVVVSKRSSGLYGSVSAEITINGNTFTISKTGIQVGTETLLIKVYNSAGTAEIMPPYYVGSSYKIVAYGSGTALEPDENFFWTVTPPASCQDCFISIYDGAIIPFTANDEGSFTFKLKYYKADACGWSDEVTRSVNFELGQLLFSIYPNPATNLLTIELAGEGMSTYQSDSNMFLSRTTSMSVAPYTVQLWHERNGLVRTAASTESVMQISLQDLPKGMYLVHLLRDGQVKQKQLLLVR